MHGYDVEIITSDRFPALEGYDRHIGRIRGNRIIGPGIYEDNGMTIHRLPAILEIKDGGQILLKGLKNKLKSLKPDIVQAHGAFCPLTLQSVFYSRELGYKIFVDDHTNKDNFRLDSLIKKIYIYMVIKFYSKYSERVSYWMPVTFGSIEVLDAFLRIERSKIKLTPLGVDSTRFYESNDLRCLGRTELGIENEILIVSAGKFNEHKDIDVLIKAFNEVAEKHPTVKLLLIGDGPMDYMRKLKSVIDLYLLNDKILFKDFVENSELPKYYNAADIGVWPGDASITVIEALATGLPILLPQQDSNYGIIFNCSAAQGFKRGDFSSLALMIMELIENENFRKYISSNGKELISKKLSWEKIAEHTISLYFNNF